MHTGKLARVYKRTHTCGHLIRRLHFCGVTLLDPTLTKTGESLYKCRPWCISCRVGLSPLWGETAILFRSLSRVLPVPLGVIMTRGRWLGKLHLAVFLLSALSHSHRIWFYTFVGHTCMKWVQLCSGHSSGGLRFFFSNAEHYRDIATWMMVLIYIQLIVSQYFHILSTLHQRVKNEHFSCPSFILISRLNEHFFLVATFFPIFILLTTFYLYCFIYL